MPFYTFSCNSCGNKFEVMCSIKELESGNISCPSCGANELDRIFEGFTVTVKGGAGAISPREGGCPAMAKGCPHAGNCGCHCHGEK